MNKKTILILMAACIAVSGCGGSKAPNNKKILDNSSQKAQTNATSVSPAESNVKNDYSKYNGNWVTENHIKNDTDYGICLSITSDKDGNIKGEVSNCTSGATHVAGVNIKGKAESTKFTTEFDEDGWGHSGTIELNFEDTKIVLNIKYNASKNKSSQWGIGEGNYILVNSNTKINSTLSDLKNGGLQVIDKQCFKTNFENFDNVKFVSGLKHEGYIIAAFYLVDDKENVLYKLPDFYGNFKGTFDKILAISFADANGDGLKDIIIAANYKSGSTNKIISSIYFQKGKEFITDKTFDEKLNASSSNKDISSILKYAKENLKK